VTPRRLSLRGKKNRLKKWKKNGKRTTKEREIAMDLLRR
jgi:hypothetical protein